MAITTVGKHPNIIRGNRADLLIHLKADSVAVTNLASAIAARFIAVNRKTKEIAIDKSLADLFIDDPEIGTIKVALSSADTDIEEGRYDIAVQFQWGPTDILEWNFTEHLVILKGIIPN